MKVFKIIFILAVLLIISAMTAVTAQVTMGADNAPSSFSVLELISGGNKGLRLPQMSDADKIAAFGAANQNLSGNAEAMGLQIFNTKTKCVETWNGADWIQQCQMCGSVPCLFITPPTHYDPTCVGNARCADLDGFMVSPLPDGDLVFDGTKNTALAAAGAAFTMKPVTGGIFYMGSQTNSILPNYDYDSDADATPVHQTGISSFYMGETEVTQGLYNIVMAGTNKQNFTASYGLSATHPAYYVSWYDAITFCNKLSILLDKTPVYTVSTVSDWAGLTAIPTSANANWNVASINASANGFRLPTEAEWEYASRGGQKNEYTRTLGASGTQYLYSGSNTLGDVAWYGYNSGNTSHSVKTMQPNDLGLYDMAGNLWEWCWDWYGFYQPCCDEKDPRGAATSTGFRRVVRGGDWYDEAVDCRVSHRDYDDSYYRYAGLGFRVVLVP